MVEETDGAFSKWTGHPVTVAAGRSHMPTIATAATHSDHARRLLRHNATKGHENAMDFRKTALASKAHSWQYGERLHEIGIDI